MALLFSKDAYIALLFSRHSCIAYRISKDSSIALLFSRYSCIDLLFSRHFWFYRAKSNIFIVLLEIFYKNMSKFA